MTQVNPSLNEGLLFTFLNIAVVVLTLLITFISLSHVSLAALCALLVFLTIGYVTERRDATTAKVLSNYRG